MAEAPSDNGPSAPEAIVVTAHEENPDLEDTHPRTTLGEIELERSAGEGLAASLSDVPGVRLNGSSSVVSKPMIRGYQERRLLLLYDGVRHEGQNWGPEHAPEIDPFTAGEISVIRGVAGARYGPDAIGGVILVEPPPMRLEAGVGGKAALGQSSNGRQSYGALRLDWVPEEAEKLSFRIEGDGSIGASLSTPDYVLGNTAAQVWNLGGAAEYRLRNGHVRSSWHHYDLKGGVFYGVQNSSPTEFEAGQDGGAPVTADLWSTSYIIDRPYQDVTHDVAILHTSLYGSWGVLEANYAFQLNRRREFAQVRESITGPQFDFTLRTHSLDVLYQHLPVETGFGTLVGGVGTQWSFQENVYRGFSLIPNYRSLGGGAYAFERLSRSRLDFEVGARYDRAFRAMFLNSADYSEHLRRETLNPSMCDVNDDGSARCPFAYDALSLSAGSLFHLIPGRMDLKVDVSSTGRIPDVDELFLSGYAPSFPVYALGEPTLDTESAYGLSVTQGLRSPWVEMEVSGFANLVDNYIYFAPALGEAGQPLFDVTIQGTWPRYTYRAVQAGVSGVDGFLKVGTETPIGLDLRGGIVRAVDRESGDFLIGTPADYLSASVLGRRRALGSIEDILAQITLECVARQTRTDLEADFAPPPPGYVLLGAGLEGALPLETMMLRVGIEGRNLLNQRYRDYTSIMRYYADQPGRDFRVRLSANF